MIRGCCLKAFLQPQANCCEYAKDQNPEYQANKFPNHTEITVTMMTFVNPTIAISERMLRQTMVKKDVVPKRNKEVRP